MILDVQLSDFFDKSFGVTVTEDHTDLLDWPGKPMPQARELMGKFRRDRGEKDVSEADFLKTTRLLAQVRLERFASPLVKASSVWDPQSLENVRMAFVMRSVEYTRARPGPEPQVVLDALWLSYASFAARSLTAHWPNERTVEADDEKLRIAFHFAMRINLYRSILSKTPVDRRFIEDHWNLWPKEWEGNLPIISQIEDNLARIIIGHEFAHIAHHSDDEGASLVGVRRRGIIPAAWVDRLIEEHGEEAVVKFIYEAEADSMAVYSCITAAEGDLQVAYSIPIVTYYFLRCLDELDKRVSSLGLFAMRAKLLRQIPRPNFFWGDDAFETMENDFQRRAGFFFSIADQIFLDPSKRP